MVHPLRQPWADRVLLGCAWLLAATLAEAQSRPAASAPSAAPVAPTPRAVDPSDAQARVPALVYRSALDGYRPLGDDRRVTWQEANEVVNRIGGWRAYARQAHQADTPASAARPAASGPAAAPAHRGHHRP